MMEHELALPQGFRFDEYEIHRVLEAGGFGITYLGWDHSLNKPMAIKEHFPNDWAVRKGDTNVVVKSSADHNDFAWSMEQFLREARILAGFDHRNMPKVHRYFKRHGTAYIVMEYVEGETLSKCYERHGTLPQAQLEKIILPLLDGLEIVHSAGYFHRDIKPANIIIRENGSPVLIDFGAARAMLGAKSRSVTVILTPGYAPIEQYSTKGNLGPWTDIYALGAVLYTGMVGKPPDDATNRVLNDEMVPLTQGGISGDAAFLAAIDCALQVEVSARPQNIDQWRDMFVKKNDAKSPPLKPEPEREPPKVPPAFYIFGSIAAAIIIGVAIIWAPTPSQLSDSEKWQDLIKVNTSAKYRKYIDDGGSYHVLATAKLKTLDRDYWDKTIERNTTEAYKEYVGLFPDGIYIKLAKIKTQK